jgi:hypothetical protein
VGGYELDALGAMTAYFHHHGLVGNPNALRWLLRRPPASLADFLSGELPKLDLPARRGGP